MRKGPTLGTKCACEFGPYFLMAFTGIKHQYSVEYPSTNLVSLTSNTQLKNVVYFWEVTAHAFLM